MARLSKQDFKKLTKATKFKGTILRGVRWNPSRKDKATDRAWTTKVQDRTTKET